MHISTKRSIKAGGIPKKKKKKKDGVVLTLKHPGAHSFISKGVIVQTWKISKAPSLGGRLAQGRMDL